MKLWKECTIPVALCLVFAMGVQAQETGNTTTPVAPAGNISGTVSFETWLQNVRAEAETQGIRKATIDAVFEKIELLPKVVALDKKQPEHTITFREYLPRAIPASRVQKGRQMLAANRALLKEIEEKYGVQARFIVALWGIETDFGSNTGGFYVPASLATLAYEGRRSAFFKDEFMKSLKIIDEGHVPPHDMTGSWAGAMGQCQFMPSSFLKFAEDYNGDGKRDIWMTKADLFASIANYLKQSGWQKDETWGRQVKLPEGFDVALTGKEIIKPLTEWQKLGVRREDGSDLPARDLAASIILPGGDARDAFITYKNYTVVMQWNRSNYFATAVGLLADALE